MNTRDFIIGYICSRMGCGTVYREETDGCGNCGSADTKPVYDYFKFFKISEDFDNKELASAYKKLSLKYHPDINKSGNEMFLIVSEGYQILKDASSLSQYRTILARVRSGDFGRQQVNAGNAYGGSSQYNYYQRDFSQEDFENFFKEFHNFMRPDEGFLAMSRTTGILAGILGFLFGFFMGGTFLGVLGAFFGYFFGRLSPGLGPLLIRLLSIIVFGLALYFSITFFRMGHIPGVVMIGVSVLLFLSVSRKWKRDLGLKK